jgi:hypothetical protein
MTKEARRSLRKRERQGEMDLDVRKDLGTERSNKMHDNEDDE